MDFMLVLQNVLLAFAEISVGEGLKYIAAAIAVFTGFACALGEGNVAAHALDAMARQPEIAGNLRVSMLIGQAVSETSGLYGLVIAILILFI